MAVIASSTAALNANWMPDRNRFGLPKPPAWFLKAMWDMDAMLVIAPSRQSRKYLLCRRRERSKVMHAVIAQTLKKHQRVKDLDADLLEANALVLVDTIQGNVYGGTWNPAMLADLKDRDMWAAGGADKYIEKIEGQEEAARKKQRASLLDDIDHRARDAYRSYKARTGQRNHHAKNAPVKKSSSGSIAGSGSGIVLTDLR